MREKLLWLPCEGNLALRSACFWAASVGNLCTRGSSRVCWKFTPILSGAGGGGERRARFCCHSRGDGDRDGCGDGNGCGAERVPREGVKGCEARREGAMVAGVPLAGLLRGPTSSRRHRRLPRCRLLLFPLQACVWGGRERASLPWHNPGGHLSPEAVPNPPPHGVCPPWGRAAA